MSRNKILISALALVSLIVLSLSYMHYKKKCNRGIIKFYVNRSSLGKALTSEEAKSIERFRVITSECISQIENQAEVIKIESFMKGKASEKQNSDSPFLLLVKQDELVSELKLEDKKTLKAIRRCHCSSKKQFSSSAKENFKSAIKKLNLTEKVDLFHGVK